MGVIQRNTKTSSGSRSFAGGTIINDDEVDADFDTVYGLVNGNIDKDNIDPNAQIPNSSLVVIEPSYVNDHSDDAATYLTTTASGDSGTPGTLATTLEGEIERIRMRLKDNNSQTTGLKYIDTADAIQTAGWVEPPRVGRNMLPNPGFELQSGAANSAPDGWTLVGVPTAVAIEAAALPSAGVDKRSLRILGSGASTGISKIVGGLKPGVKYMVGMAYTLTTGKVNLTTTNALGSGEYKEFSYQDTSPGNPLEIVQGIVKADATATPITVSIVSSANLDDFNLYYVWFYELSGSAPHEIPHIPMQTATDSVEKIYPAVPSGGGVTDWETITPLSLSQYVPYEGYRFIYEVTLCLGVEEIIDAPTNNFENYQHGLRLQIDGVTEGGERWMYGEWNNENADNAAGKIITLRAVVENPTPGATVAFTTDVGVYNDSGLFGFAIMNPLRQGEQAESFARLYTERL